MACGDECKIEFYQVVPGTVRVTRRCPATADTGTNCPVFKDLTDQQQTRIADQVTAKKNAKEKVIGEKCPGECPCDAGRPDFDATDAVPEQFSGTISSGACKWSVSGTYMVKSKTSTGSCNTPDEVDEFGELEFAMMDEQQSGEFA